MLGNHATRRNRFCSKDKMLRAAVLRSDLEDKLGCGLGIFSRDRLTRFSPWSLSNTRILAPGDCARHVDAIKQIAARSIFIGVSSFKIVA